MVSSFAAIGSIPAHAGEPACSDDGAGQGGVYPRPRGGTPPQAEGGANGAGLSPPTRGNPSVRSDCIGRGRSIPAHAGEPAGGDERIDREQVYPRPRGGTSPAAWTCGDVGGLSPPTRGNQPERDLRSLRDRSIPAHAGEPAPTRGKAPIDEVYPRPRGGTRRANCYQRHRLGLSPPTRGNRAVSRNPLAKAGSIPAHAGEPSPRPPTLCRYRVYPRPRGGTLAVRELRQSAGGLSPPTRGNRRRSCPRF